uniref:Seminal vesicle secretory protein 5 n=2 Tax=Rattus norvegicus TaxID=10116 RepID=SVS5_RAT|nr:RecName: Full=Seminal vesicle secretory protein 5; AltName: Full=SVS protein F; AltName: Full=Seminal vesicle secretory protein V; Short=SVS V; Flags: Precursor [Rattus norvegicus]AAA42191.1 androgen-responsive protein precursor [Rattus norvegicus]
MSPTGFFLLTVLLVLVTEAASRGPREKFSQSAEDPYSENMNLKILASGRGSSSTFGAFSRSENSRSNFKSKSPSSITREKVNEESRSEMSSTSSHFGLKMRRSHGGGEMNPFETKVKTRITRK